MTTSGSRELISTGAAARRLGVSNDTILRWVEQGALTPAAVTEGGHHRFHAADVDRIGAPRGPRDRNTTDPGYAAFSRGGPAGGTATADPAESGSTQKLSDTNDTSDTNGGAR